MAWLFQPLLMLLARSTEGDLAKHVEFLKAENVILRSRLGGQVRLRPDEQRLLRALPGMRDGCYPSGGRRLTTEPAQLRCHPRLF